MYRFQDESTSSSSIVEIAYYDELKSPEENAHLLFGTEHHNQIEEREVKNLFYERLIQHMQERATRMLCETGRISNEMRILLVKLEDAQSPSKFEEGIELIRVYERNADIRRVPRFTRGSAYPSYTNAYREETLRLNRK